MDEDEECLAENCSLNLYLQDLGLRDAEVFKTKSTPTHNKSPLAKLNDIFGLIDKDVIEQIKMITSTKLLFAEDMNLVEILLTRFIVGDDKKYNFMFSNSITGAVTVFGLCLYFVIGYFAFVFLSVFFAYRWTYVSFATNFDKIHIKKLRRVVINTSSILDKSVSYIKRNKNTVLQDQSESEFSLRINCYYGFKSQCLSSIKKMMDVLIKLTRKLIKNVPLLEGADTPEFYICTNFDDLKNFFEELEDPTESYYVYLLLQSQFLRRLILSFIPNLHKLSNEESFASLRKIMNEACNKLTSVEKQLGKDFFYVFYTANTIKHNPLVTPKPNLNDQYTKALYTNIGEISNVIENVLFKCKTVEENFKSDQIPKSLEDDLLMLQDAVYECEKVIKYCFITLKKAKAEDDAKKNKSSWSFMTIRQEKKLEEKDSNAESESIPQGVLEYQSEDNPNKIKVNYTDLDHVVEDDVFEAYISNENQNRELNENYWDLEEFLNRKLKKDFSKNVMKELKVRLVEKAKEWKERELNVLKKKGLIDDNNAELLKDEIVNTETEIESLNNKQESFCLEKPNPYDSNESKEAPRRFLRRDDCSKSADENSSKSDDVVESQPFFLPNKEFLSNICKARDSIMQSVHAEEEFCLSNSDEDTDGECTE